MCEAWVGVVELYHEAILSAYNLSPELQLTLAASKILRNLSLVLSVGCAARLGFGRERKVGSETRRAVGSRDAELRGASRLGEPFLARNGSISQQTQQPSQSCQTAKMTFAWKAAGIT